MLHKKIICVGNRLLPTDCAGPMVYDYLATRPLPIDTEIIDGGLGGLDLLPFVEGAGKVVFVDTISGFATAKELLVLGLEDLINNTVCNNLNHGNGLIYLLHVLPKLLQEKLPKIFLVGINGSPSPQIVSKAAETSLHILLKAS